MLIERRWMSQCNGAWQHIRFIAAFAVLMLLLPHAALATGPRVILLRGWFGVFSTGLDSIADQLKALGIEAKVAGHKSNEVAEILRNRSGGYSGSLVLVGHSQGANNVIDMARSLGAYNVTVDLLIALSPFMQNPTRGTPRGLFGSNGFDGECRLESFSGRRRRRRADLDGLFKICAGTVKFTPSIESFAATETAACCGLSRSRGCSLRSLFRFPPSRAGRGRGPSRLKVPSSRFDLSTTMRRNLLLGNQPIEVRAWAAGVGR